MCLYLRRVKKLELLPAAWVPSGDVNGVLKEFCSGEMLENATSKMTVQHNKIIGA
jgi:hypothetical protein